MERSFKRTYQTVVVDNMDDTAQVVIYRVVDITKTRKLQLLKRKHKALFVERCVILFYRVMDI